jgi:hypothetical protein
MNILENETFWEPILDRKDDYFLVGLPKADFTGGNIELTFLFNTDNKDYYIDTENLLYVFDENATGGAQKVEINKYFQHLSKNSPLRSKALYIRYEGTSDWATFCLGFSRDSGLCRLHYEEWAQEDLIEILNKINLFTKASLALKYRETVLFGFGIYLVLNKRDKRTYDVGLSYQSGKWSIHNPPNCLTLSNGVSIWETGLQVDDIITNYFVPAFSEELDLNVPLSTYVTQKRLVPTFA